MNINDYPPLRAGKLSIVKSSENRCEHIGNNRSLHEIRQYQIDGGVIPSNTPGLRCDYLVLNDTKKSAYYIELKGSDIERAINQIENTIVLLKDSLREYAIYRRIVYRSGTSSLQGSKALLWKRQHTNAIIKERRLEENLS